MILGREEVPRSDNASAELVDLARAGDESGFRALASCLMPAGEVEECWHGVRARLGHLAVEASTPERRELWVPEGRFFRHPVPGEIRAAIYGEDENVYLPPHFTYCMTEPPDPVCRCGAYRLEWVEP